MWHHWCPAMPVCEASWGTLAHTGDAPLISIGSRHLPEGFCSEGQHRANLSNWLLALNRFQLGRKSQDQDLHHIPSPLPGGKRWDLSNSERRRLEASCYWFGTDASSPTGKTWNLWGKKEKQNGQEFSLDLFSSVPLQLLPLWAKPSKASCQATAPVLATPLERQVLQLEPLPTKPSHPALQPHTGDVINFCTRSDLLAWQP